MSSDFHWCWVNQTRVQRRGSAMECHQCRRFKARHKCGADPDKKTAWKDYPAEECAACSSKFEPGKFPEGPSEAPPPRVKPPRVSERAVNRKDRKAAVERKRTRREMMKDKARRKTLIVLAVSRRTRTRREIFQLLSEFNLHASEWTMKADLEELVAGNWIEKQAVMVERKSKHIAPYTWHYRLNEALEARL